MFRSLLREPLVHFLLLGAGLFMLDAWLRPAATASAASKEIVVSEARITNLAQNFRRTWQRPPTRQELDGIIEAFVREEVMVREALALGLDRDDAIIRRRLQQKMEFVSEEAAASVQPSDAELERYLSAHADAFRTEPRVTFVQVYLDPRRRGAALEADAKRLLEVLNGERPIDPAQAGDRLLLLDARYENAPQSEVARLFGSDFAAALVEQPPGRWAGPVTSGYGAHLVRVEALTPGQLPSLDDVRPLVEREWANARRQELARAFYEKLRARYTVKVQRPEPAGQAPAAGGS
jgi:parvulin-like peptidyl-prolyl isomerase